MKLFEGKSPTERNKIIAAIVLGVMATAALSYTFIGNPFSSKKTITVSVSPTPTPTVSPNRNAETAALPNDEEVNFQYTTTPVVYNPARFYAPDAGRNIFAFYEPPPPTPYSPTPTPEPKTFVPETPTPTPVPPFLVGFVAPESVYAGSKSFRLEVSGDKFTPDSLIFLNGNQLPTTYISPQRLVADVPSNFISGVGAIQIIVRTPDGKLYSNQVVLNVEAPPVPQFQYIGMIARQRFNNDTAYFQEQEKKAPFGARLNDVVGGRYRLTSISASETIFEDVSLGFKHRLALLRPQPGQNSDSNYGQNPNPNPNTINSPGRYQNKGGNNFNNPNNPNIQSPVNITPQGEIPGIPTNIPIYIPPQPPPPKVPNKDDDDDDGND